MSTAWFTEITKCRGCRYPNGGWEIVLAMEPMPLAGEFSASRLEAANASVYPLTLIQCSRCTLVQVLEDVSDGELFRSYRYASSTVPDLVRYFEAYATYLRTVVTSDRPRVLEIGCNDGVLLRRLPASWTCVGVDPSDVARNAAPGGYELVPEAFTSALAENLASEGVFDLITSSNTLAHVSDLKDVFAGVAESLSPDGLFVFEVHDLDATLRNGQWDTVYHEHKVEWSERSLAICLAGVGLRVDGVERTVLHGGALRVTARAIEGPAVQIGRDQRRSEAQGIDHLRQAYDRRRESAVYRQLEELRGQGEALCAYGASGRANVWLNQCPEMQMEFIVDESPLRTGRWIPRVGVPIVGPSLLYDRRTGGCVITAWNYAADIRSRHEGYAGAWFLPFTQ